MAPLPVTAETPIENVPSHRGKKLPALLEDLPSYRVHDDVDTVVLRQHRILGSKVHFRVIEHMVRSERPRKMRSSRRDPAVPKDLGPQMLCDLDCRKSYASGGGVDKQLLPGAKIRQPDKPVVRAQIRNKERRCFFVTH